MNTVFKAEKRHTLAEQIIAQIRNAIVSGELKPGMRLTEKEVAESLAIGRNAVREAFRCLETEGYLTITPFKGASVSVPSNDQIEQMFVAMSELEGVCARLAVQRMMAEDLDQIEALHVKLEQLYQANEHQTYLEVNWELHEFIQNLAGNETLKKFIDESRIKLSIYRRKQLYQPNRFHASLLEHRKILQAFRSKDSNAAEQSMREHLLCQGKALTESGSEDLPVENDT